MSDPPTPSPWILRPHDQRTVAALVLLGLVALAVYWLAGGGPAGQLVELDRQAIRPARFRVDLNTAAWPELAQLPGLGETLARRIVESRQLDGPYTTHDDLRRVSGVGPKKLAKIKPYLLPISNPSATVPDAGSAVSNEQPLEPRGQP
ncbi:MAG TPA: helix-hairpin-helix domain-containing protein [Pirellulales bacterium]|nr:helix-hairpin-helix domain-containing protein [Pirellulales bacterium]